MLTMQTKTTTDESDSRTLIDSHELARRLSMSHKWVEKNRYRIAGAQSVEDGGSAVMIDSPFIREGRAVSFPFGFAPTFHSYRLGEPQCLKKPSTIFVCSMADLFGEWVPNEWIQQVFDDCAKAPQHRYLFLTKNSERYQLLSEKGILPYNNNCWFGATTETPDRNAYFSKSCNNFLSIEPIQSVFDKIGGDALQWIKWVVIGAESGNRKDKVIPHREWIDCIVNKCRDAGLPVFLKDSLIPIIGEENMIREFPWEVKK